MPRVYAPIFFSRQIALACAVILSAAATACGGARGPVLPTALPTVRVVTVLTSATPPASPTTAVEPTLPLATAPVEATADPSVTPPPTAPAATESQPTPDAQGETRPVRLPILMYHYVEPWPKNADEIR